MERNEKANKGKQGRFPNDVEQLKAEGTKRAPSDRDKLVVDSAGDRLRHFEQLPESRRPDLEGLPPVRQIAALLAAWWTYTGVRNQDSGKCIREIRDVVRIYTQLEEAGCKLPDVVTFREKHARMLLVYWRDKKQRKATTIEVYWSRLITWTRVLGKWGMVDSLEKYWPERPKADQGTTHGKRTQDARLGESGLTELFRARDRTHWFVQRFHEDLGLTFEEALRFDRVAAADVLHGRVFADPGSGSRKRIVVLETEGQRLLVQQAVDFLNKTNRRQLMWPRCSLSEAVRKHENRVAYLRRKMKKEQRVETSSGVVQSTGKDSSAVPQDSEARKETPDAQ